MQSLLDTIIGLPPAALFPVLALAATIENLVPPFPSDVIIAFGGFVAAQGHHSPVAVFLAVLAGNVAGAMAVYALGRRYGAARLERRLAGRRAQRSDALLRRMFDRYGMPAVFVSRFVPGVRAVVPAFAGALRLPILTTAVMIASASALWYGFITYVAFRVGTNWEELRAIIARYGFVIAVVATALLALGVIAWLVARRRRRT